MGPPAITPRASLLTVLLALILAGVLIWQMPAYGPSFLIPAALAAALAGAFTPVAIYLSYRLRILDIPGARKGHDRPMPLLGGPAVLAAFAIAAAISIGYLHTLPDTAVPAELQSQLVWTLIAGGLITVMGVVDDKWGLKPGVRIIGQLAAVCLVMRHGVVMTFLPPNPVGQMGEVVLTVIWIVGITNAMNFLDGLDGLASGVAAVAALSFAAIAAMTGQLVVATASVCLAGAALGFFTYNSRPASVYLGDSGATLLGFTLACIGLIGDWGTDAPVMNLFVPVIVLGIPIYDTIYITVYRIKAGLVTSLKEWAAYVGHDHLHHRLQHLGMRPGRACLFICLGGVVLGVLAVILKTKDELDHYDKFLALALVVILFVGATILMELGKNRTNRR